MQEYQVLSIILAVIVGILIPLLVFIVRGAIKWTRVEEKMDHVIKNLAHIVEDKDRVHNEIYTQMREDRAATDRRLRWLEENLWNKKGT